MQQNYRDQLFDLFNFAVYINNLEIIKQAEKTHKQLNINTESMVKEAIGYHHNNIAFYIQHNYIDQ